MLEGNAVDIVITARNALLTHRPEWTDWQALVAGLIAVIEEQDQTIEKLWEALKPDLTCRNFSHFTTDMSHCPKCGGTWKK